MLMLLGPPNVHHYRGWLPPNQYRHRGVHSVLGGLSGRGFLKSALTSAEQDSHLNVASFDPA